MGILRRQRRNYSTGHNGKWVIPIAYNCGVTQNDLQLHYIGGRRMSWLPIVVSFQTLLCQIPKRSRVFSYKHIGIEVGPLDSTLSFNPFCAFVWGVEAQAPNFEDSKVRFLAQRS